MKSEIIFSPTNDELNASAMAQFCHAIAEKYGLENSDYESIRRWSVDCPELYWQEILFRGEVLFGGEFTRAMNGNKFFQTEWFPGLSFNYAENMLRKGDSTAVAIHSIFENGTSRAWTFEELNAVVRKMAGLFQQIGLQKGDKIGAVLPNSDLAILCSLAAGALGIIWSSASPDLGKEGITERFSQIQPKLLISVNAYRYNGKLFEIGEKIEAVKKELSDGIQHIEFEYEESANKNSFADFSLSIEEIKNLTQPADFSFEQLPFSHPLYILFSSGTTGVPKCITHSHGGVLFQHTSEHMLHCDVRSGDRMFFFTTCGWMMWNWMVSALGRGAAVIAFDGSPAFGNSHYLWTIAERFRATHLGMGAKYVSICAQDQAAAPPLQPTDLRTIFTTGSPLTEDLFDYLSKITDQKVRISSISGGTDILGCFVGGNPLLPVYRGEIQCRLLGMDVHAFNETGESVTDEKGDLVCLKPFPSTPVCFQNDPGDEKYKQAYFDVFPDVWTHGDFISIHSKTGGVVIYGRSDTTLNPGGVRIGAAEIYRHVEDMEAIAESVVIGRQQAGDEQIVLFVVMKKRHDFNEDTENRIRQTIRRRTTPRHVPAYIIPVGDVPKTLTGKKMEKLLKNIFAGKTNDNLSAVANPECITEYRKIAENLSIQT